MDIPLIAHIVNQTNSKVYRFKFKDSSIIWYLIAIVVILLLFGIMAYRVLVRQGVI